MRNKKGQFVKGNIPWLKGTKGLLKVSEETKKKMSKSMKLVKHSGLFEKGHTPWMKGKIFHKRECQDCKKSIVSYQAKRCGSCAQKIVFKKTKGENHWAFRKKRPEITGKNHYKWKGGSDHLERTRFGWTMRKIVFERDDYTCQLCGIKGVALQVDHIQSWAEYIELRFSMDNCRTLCQPCHYFITFNKPMSENNTKWGLNTERRENGFLKI